MECVVKMGQSSGPVEKAGPLSILGRWNQFLSLPPFFKNSPATEPSSTVGPMVLFDLLDIPPSSPACIPGILQKSYLLC